MTYLPKEDVQSIIELSGQMIRKFLSTGDPTYFQGDARASIVAFRNNPMEFTDQSLVSKGANIDLAHQYPVRIELRGVNHLGAAQVVAKGVWGVQREDLVDVIRQELQLKGKKLLARTAGSSSFEFNRLGVDKSLPLRYLRVAWPSVLEQMRYTPGPSINALATRTVIAADGDGTVYDGPKTTYLPMLKESVVFRPLMEYLRAGGIFMLVSGNDINRTFKRLTDGLPKEFYGRVLLSANGGADLVTIDANGSPVFDQRYRAHALNLSQAAAQFPNLDIVYIGDDGSPNGNDRAAFETVGFDRCVLVAPAFDITFEPFLIPVYVGNTMEGTRRYLELVNKHIVKHAHQPVFNDNLEFCRLAANNP